MPACTLSASSIQRRATRSAQSLLAQSSSAPGRLRAAAVEEPFWPREADLSRAKFQPECLAMPPTLAAHSPCSAIRAVRSPGQIWQFKGQPRHQRGSVWAASDAHLACAGWSGPLPDQSMRQRTRMADRPAGCRVSAQPTRGLDALCPRVARFIRCEDAPKGRLWLQNIGNLGNVG